MKMDERKGKRDNGMEKRGEGEAGREYARSEREEIREKGKTDGKERERIEE